MEETYALGLDLGTTFSCIGCYQNGEVEIIPNRNGDRITPSIVTITDSNTILKGEEALDHLVKDYDSSIYAIKRFIGRDFGSKEVKDDLKKQNYLFTIKEGEDKGNPFVEIKKNGKTLTFSLEEISSFIIKKMVSNAENYLDRNVNKLVITVPAYFDNNQKKCTENAAKLAGVEVLRLVNEPIAAALAYALQNKENKMKGKILVFDLGGGTFDVSVLSINNIDEENIQILSKKGDKFLGGEDFDNKLVNYFLNKFCDKMGEDKDQILQDKKIIKKLKISCEKIKRALSTNENNSLYITNFYNNKDMNEFITRDIFENECQDLFDRLKKPIEDALIGAKIIKKDIEEIVLVGGSTRMPKIEQILKEFFGENIKINNSIDPDETVAYGATLIAAKILIKRDKYLDKFNLMDITTYSLGVAVQNLSKDKNILKEGNMMSVIIKRNNNFPCDNENIYVTSHDNQTQADINIYEGEKKYVKYNHILGVLILKNLPPKPKGEVKIKVQFKINKNGILTVYASELSKDGKEKNKINTEIKYQSFKLDDKAIENLKKKNQKYLECEDENLNMDFSDIREALNDYKAALQKAKTEKDKCKILINYNNTYEELLDSFDKNFDNETMLEKYFIFLKELLKSYTELLNLNSGISLSNSQAKALQVLSEGQINNIMDKIKNYIVIFTGKSSGYLNELLEILKRLSEEYFFEIVIFTMEELNNFGKQCLEKKNKFCKYNSLVHFEKAKAIFSKYIIDISNLGSLNRNIIDNCKKQIKISLLYINEIKSGAILLLEDSLRTGKLIPSGTGNTNLIYSLHFSENETREKYEIILQNYENILREFPEKSIQTSKKSKKDQLDIGINEAVCIANIIKIDFQFLGNSNYERLLDLCHRCKRISNNFPKAKEAEWYKEFETIYQTIQKQKEKWEESLNKIREKIKNKYREKFETIENKFSTRVNNIDFINFILEKHPYEGYEKDKKDKNQKKVDFSKESQELLNFLRGKYHIDRYKYDPKDDNSLLNYFIIEIIYTKLNDMFNNY